MAVRLLDSLRRPRSGASTSARQGPSTCRTRTMPDGVQERVELAQLAAGTSFGYTLSVRRSSTLAAPSTDAARSSSRDRRGPRGAGLRATDSVRSVARHFDCETFSVVLHHFAYEHAPRDTGYTWGCVPAEVVIYANRAGSARSLSTNWGECSSCVEHPTRNERIEDERQRHHAEAVRQHPVPLDALRVTPNRLLAG